MTSRPQYGPDHVRARKAMLKLVQWGTTRCCRCEHPLEYGDRVDADHNDNGIGYRGLAHSSPCQVCLTRCNQEAGGNKRALQAGQQLRDRNCPICGKPFRATTGTSGAVQATCGTRDCITELRRIRKARQPDPEPPAQGGRIW
jgi:hypothetical protein